MYPDVTPLLDGLGFLPPQVRASLVGGTRLHTVWEGSATVWRAWGSLAQPTVILLHGGSGSWTHWVRNVVPLQAAGWRVLVPDLPGFGDSDLPPGCTDVDALPAHLHAGLQQLQARGACGDRVHLVGFSFGGMAAALWLAAYPQDAQQLVLVGAPGMGLTVPERIPLKGWRHLPTPEAQDQVHRHNLMALMLQHPHSLDDLALSLHAANVRRDRMPRRRLSSTAIVATALPLLSVPVSAIYGECDALYKGRLPALQLAMQALASQWGQWHTLAGAGHWVPYEAAAQFNEALLNTLTP
jgi:2-hydroxy-6-oxonona-2,4-dienedioate hydrolase